ncbi:MAG: RNA methyltransferase [Eubacteriales bacterium]|nr:RNA methyltransferase [Eubacteriales bacterium]MDD3502535.1 RNA methyltransferase [Eubacteriales bacterium]MDD4683015.1 RNA methyltransferase [Eubacteriales bacterium]
MLRQISSRDNQLIKYFRQLNKSSFSRKEGLILIEGFRQVEEALLSDLTVRYFIFTAEARQNDNWQRFGRWEDQLFQKSDCIELPRSIFTHISGTENPQGVAIVCGAPAISNPVEAADQNGLYLILEELQDPGNMGTIIRTADAFACAGIIMTSGCVWPYYDKVLRAAMGSIFHLPIYDFNRVDDAVAWLRKSGVRIIAADPKGVPVSQMKMSEPTRLTRPLAIVIGNEGRGLSTSARDLADDLVSIPMPGNAESLNAAVAASILCYEAAKII